MQFEIVPLWPQNDHSGVDTDILGPWNAFFGFNRAQEWHSGAFWLTFTTDHKLHTQHPVKCDASFIIWSHLVHSNSALVDQFINTLLVFIMSIHNTLTTNSMLAFNVIHSASVSQQFQFPTYHFTRVSHVLSALHNLSVTLRFKGQYQRKFNSHTQLCTAMVTTGTIPLYSQNVIISHIR